MDNMRSRGVSVPYGDDVGILEAFERDGYCVVTGILSPQQVSAALDELWTNPRLLGNFDRNDALTWGHPSWPQQAGGRNFLASSDVYQDKASWDIQSNEKLLHVQQLLHRSPDIMMTGVGRWGVMRPTKHNPEWKTDSSWLHWDQNPWTEPDFCRVQAIVCLTDNTITSGGFACVPGFHRRFQKWGQDHPMGTLEVGGKVVNETYGAGQPFPVPLDDPIQKDVTRVTAPAGSAVIWDSRLPHQNFPNTDEHAFRVVHYTMMQFRDENTIAQRKREYNQKRVLMDVMGKTGPRFPHHLSATGKFVHGLDEDRPELLEQSLKTCGVEDVSTFIEAAGLVREAGRLEEEGDVNGAIRKHQKSIAIFPEIEEWHHVIFG